MKTLNHHEFTELSVHLREAASVYYSGDGSPLIDDATYDAGIRSLKEATKSHPEWTDADDLLEVVAAGTSKGNIAHSVPMLSLDNAMDNEELTAFFKRISKVVDADEVEWVVEAKLDGIGLAIRYVDGRLVEVLSRGSGLTAESVLDVARFAKGIPAELPLKQTIEVRGECVMTHDDFIEANQLRVDAGGTPFANPRNAVAGSIRATNRTYRVPLTFMAYGQVRIGEPFSNNQNLLGTSHSEDMVYLTAMGFTPAWSLIDGSPIVKGTQAVRNLVSQIEANRANFNVDTDGAVIKVNDAKLRKLLGEGSRAPRWAIARKFAPDTRETKLLGIDVSVGRTGNLSFTARLEPVFVGGVTISSATVHNPTQIERKFLRLPGVEGEAQRVWVRRAGEVVPEIVGPVETSIDGTIAFEPPALCPRCGGELDMSGLIWRCLQGRNCAVEENVVYAIGRDQLDIAFGGETAHALVASGRVKDIADIFTITKKELLQIDRMGNSVATKIIDSIESAKLLPLNRIFCSLGVVLTGRSMSRRLAKHFGTMPKLRSATVEELCEVEGVGKERADAIREELELLSPVIDRLMEMGIGLEETEEVIGATPFAGEIVVVTGAVPGLSRSQAQVAIERLGGKASGTVSAKSTLVIVGDGAGEKAAKAEALGIRIMAAEEFANLAAAS